MLSRIANSTTIHGVKDAWRANWVGRAFFLAVFVCCFIVMAFQLEGLFHSYISEAVGTRVTSTLKFDTVEVPSVYYCSDNWLPSSEALWHLNPIIHDNASLYKSIDILYEECIHMARYNILDLPRATNTSEGTIYLRDIANQHCRPFLDYWKSMIKQELVNAIVRPLEDGSFDYRDRLYNKRKKRPELSLTTREFAASILADPIQTLLNYEFHQGLKASVEKTILNVTLDDERSGRNFSICQIRYRSSSSVMSQKLDISAHDNAIGNLDYYYRFLSKQPGKPFVKGEYSYTGNRRRYLYASLSNSTLHPSAVSTSLDGVCWEYPAGPQSLQTKEAFGRKLRHVLIHLGGFVHQLRILLSRITPIIDRQYASFFQFPNYESYFHHHLVTLINFAKAVDFEHYTYVAVSKQTDPGLYFSQKIRVDSTNMIVNVKYWKNSVTYLNRKAWRCRPAPWTELDQAHCNQELSRSGQGTVPCETYLPASESYSETPVTKDTCIYDRTGFFRDISSALSDLVVMNATVFKQPSNNAHRLSSFGPSRIRNDHRREVISRLTIASPACPRPCSRTDFNHQTTYLSFDVRNRSRGSQCHMALAYWLTPKPYSGFYQHSLPPLLASIFRRSKIEPNHWFMGLYNGISNLYSGDDFCSVIDFEQTETHGKVSEEYLLYAFQDLVANLGGTVGLWFGASVISFIQLIYLCFLETLFRKIRRKVAAWRVETFGRFTTERGRRDSV